MINRIPYLIRNSGLNLSEFHRLMIKDEETKLSYQSLHRIANSEQRFLPSSTRIGTLQKVATVLNLTVNDLYVPKEKI